MEGSGGAEDRHAVRLATLMRSTARDLHGGFIRLGAGIAEIDLIETGQLGQFCGNAFLTRNPVKVGCVPEPAGLITKCLDKRRV